LAIRADEVGLIMGHELGAPSGGGWERKTLSHRWMPKRGGDGTLSHVRWATLWSIQLIIHFKVPASSSRHRSASPPVVLGTPSTASCSGLPVHRDRAHPHSHGHQVTRDDLRRIGAGSGRDRHAARQKRRWL